MKRAVAALGIVTMAGMFAVLVMGSAVTNTGSEQGCGKQWPLCHGKLIPQMAVKTAIEFSHRAVVGIETILILAFAAGALYLYGRRREVRVLTALMVGFLFLQAGLGAWAVLYPQEPAILALHFGVSLIAFAAVTLTAAYILGADRTVPLRGRPVPPRFRRYAWGLAAFCYMVVYLGAYVRHENASLACKGWPLCNGVLVPALLGKVASVFAHRLGAAFLAAGVLVLAVWAEEYAAQRPDLFAASICALALVALQVFSGAVVVWTHVDLFSTLLHAAVVGLLFAVLSYVCFQVLPATAAATQPYAAPPRIRPEAGTAGAQR